MIYTFYSYKGGVGRSMAMANVAEWFYEQGLRVVIIDWDLEAPGLESFFYASPKEIEVVRSQLGLIDLLMAYKRIFPRLLPPESESKSKELESRKSEQASSEQKPPPDRLQILRDNLPPISDTLYPIHAPDSKSDGKGALWLISAGWRSGDRFPAYAQAVQSFDWSDFYTSYEGESYFDWLREQLVTDDLADVVLIDSRTGVTEMGGVCTRQMADVVVSFCVPNSQNLEGVYTMAKSFNRDELVEKRKRALEMVVVPSRLDISEVDDRKVFEDQFRRRLDEFTPPAFKSVDRSFWDLQIQYVPKYAYRDGLAIRDPRVPELQKAYKKLTAHLALLAKGASGERVRTKCADELQHEFASHFAGLYQLTEEEQARYLQLAFFPEDAAISLSDAQELWDLDAAATEKLIQRLAGISLLKYEPEQQIVRLNSVVRAKLLEQMPDQEALNEKIEAAFARLSTKDQTAAHHILTRLVRLVAPDEDGDDTRQRLKVSELDASSQGVIESLAAAKLVTIEKEQATGAASVQIANEAYLTGWKRLRDWINDDRKFLLWRQQLKLKIAEWEETKRDQGALLSGVPLDVASGWRNERQAELNESEKSYIDESVSESERVKQIQRAMIAQRRTRLWAGISLMVILGIVGTLGIVQYVRHHREEERRTLAQEAARLLQVKAEEYNNSGSLELVNHNYKSALHYFNEAIQTKPDYAEAYLNRARAYGGMDQADLAIPDYTKTIRLKPELAVAYFERADLYSENNNDDLALADYTSAIKIKPDYWNAYLNRGFTYENKKSYEPAISDYTQIINSTSDQFKATSYLRRGSTFLSMGDKERATTDFLSAIALTVNQGIRVPAADRLQSLGYKPPPESQPPATLNVFLQYTDDEKIIDAISASLQKEGFKVQAKESSVYAEGIGMTSRQPSGDVRYYSNSQEVKASAEKIRTIVSQTVAQTFADKSEGSKVDLDMRTVYLGKLHPYVPRGNIEVWIPPLQKSVQPLAQSPQSRVKNFK